MRVPYELSCAICREIVTDPITLDCFHHICASHLASFGQDPVCPVCKAPSPAPEDGWKVDPVKKIVVGHFKQQSEVMKEPKEVLPQITCGYCEEQVATRRCVQCHGQAFCEECSKSVHSKGFFRDHTLVDVHDGFSQKNDFRMLCPEHTDEKLAFYCLECRTPICSHCLIVGGHQHHERTPMEDANLHAKETLVTWVEKINQLEVSTQALLESFQAAEQEVVKNGKAQRTTVNDEMDHLRELIETKRRQLLQKCALEEKQKLVHLKVQMENAQSALNELKHLKSRSEDLLDLECEQHFIVLVLQLIQDMKIRQKQPIDDQRRVATNFKQLNTDHQVRVVGDLDLTYLQPVQVIGGVVPTTEALPPMVVPFQGSSASTMPYVQQYPMVAHGPHGQQVIHMAAYRPSLPPQYGERAN